MPKYGYFKEISPFRPRHRPRPFSTYFWKNFTEKRPIHTLKLSKILQNCLKIRKKHLLSVLEQELRKSYVEFLLQTRKTSYAMPKYGYFKEISPFRPRHRPRPFSTYFGKAFTEKRPIHTLKLSKILQNCLKIRKKHLLSVLEQELRKSYVEFLLQTRKTSYAMPKNRQKSKFLPKFPNFPEKSTFFGRMTTENRPKLFENHPNCSKKP